MLLLYFFLSWSSSLTFPTCFWTFYPFAPFTQFTWLWTRMFVACLALVEMRAFFPLIQCECGHISVSCFCSVSAACRALCPRWPVPNFAVNWVNIVYFSRRQVRSFISPGQGCSLHSWLSYRSEQFFPWFNAGVVTFLFLVSFPFPQVAEHSLQGDQTPTSQSTGWTSYV